MHQLTNYTKHSLHSPMHNWDRILCITTAQPQGFFPSIFWQVVEFLSYLWCKPVDWLKHDSFHNFVTTAEVRSDLWVTSLLLTLSKCFPQQFVLCFRKQLSVPEALNPSCTQRSRGRSESLCLSLRTRIKTSSSTWKCTWGLKTLRSAVGTISRSDRTITPSR